MILPRWSLFDNDESLLGDVHDDVSVEVSSSLQKLPVLSKRRQEGQLDEGYDSSCSCYCSAPLLNDDDDTAVGVVMEEDSSSSPIPILLPRQRPSFWEENDRCYSHYFSASPLVDATIDEEQGDQEREETTAHQQEEKHQEADDSWASITTTTSIMSTIIEEEEGEEEEIESVQRILASLSNSSDATTVVANVTSTTTATNRNKHQGMTNEEQEQEKPSSMQIVLPAWLITSDDLAQILSYLYQPPHRYMEDQSYMPDSDSATEAEEKIDDCTSIVASVDNGPSATSTRSTELQDPNDCQPMSSRQIVKQLRARAPLEAPNPKKPGESNFIEEDMMDLLEMA